MLSNPLYNISDTRISYIQKIVQHTKIYNTNNITQTLTLPLNDYTNTCYGSITTKNIPQVIDIPPLFFYNSFIDIAPILVLPTEHSNIIDWTIIHELTHLFSIGQYVPYKNKCNTANQFIYHSSGINQYLYQIENNELNIHRSEKNNGLNELVTDFITWQLAQTIYNSEIEPIYNGIELFHKFIVNELAFYSIQEFIGWYFSGNIIKIKQSLLNKSYKSFDDFYFYLERNY